ncbi:DUF4115 domain-containing protein [Vogesella sp. LYT5W]|uniref:DUF4115 domain-containing protein n=1 Tax=Vogesella margarita TaxID=2984199 RepID=A0ABT5IPX1_9NEIS|nr:helix-turn-helix domain-containing protein [Vogesella margarita]MDC7714213.1 DUF4115 domain-containing protein [Vogesella margarita]
MEADNPQQDSTAVAIGRELRAAREGRGLSIGEVADRLKLSVKQLNAIESGDFASLPGATFARGFVRSYARYMEIDADALVARLDQCVPLDAPAAGLVPLDEPAARKTSLALPLSLGALLVIAGGWFLLPGSAEPEVQSSVPLALVPTVADPDASALQPTTSDVVAVAPPLVTASAPQAVAPVVAAPVTAPAAAAASAASAAAPVTGQGRIELRVRQEAWVSITDADGKKLVYATLAANDRRQLQGRPPFRVVIGNAANAELAYNGQPVDLAGKIRGTTAKLELN